ncbi:MAG: conserved phage C-terminal domain-containing protein [Candidatus Acetothermia bacterium]
MAYRGYIKLFRQIKENPIYTNSRALHVWIECLLRATHKKHEVYNKREKLVLEPGQFLLGRHEFAESVNMSPSTAWYWIDQLEVNNMIDTKRTSKGTIATIVNWIKYQHFDNGYNGKQTAKKQEKDGINNEDNGRRKKNVKKEDSPPYQEIISYLNSSAGKRYKATTKVTRKKIKARWNEGFRLEDFKTVIGKKVAEWLGDPQMETYLRPQTLFSNKFESYLNQPYPNKGGNRQGKFDGRTEEEYLKDLAEGE